MTDKTAQAFDHVYQALLALVDYAEDRELIGGEECSYAAPVQANWGLACVLVN